MTHVIAFCSARLVNQPVEMYDYTIGQQIKLVRIYVSTQLISLVIHSCHRRLVGPHKQDSLFMNLQQLRKAMHVALAAHRFT